MIPFDNKHVWKFIFAILIGFIVMIVSGIYFQKKEWEKYPKIQSQSEFKGEVYKIWNNRGVFGELKSGQKFSIPLTYNFNYDPSLISDFIKKGDFILKPSNSDSIFVFRKNTKYFFLLGERNKKNEFSE